MNKRRDILDLSAEEAKSFFLRDDSYCKFDLPNYFKFNPLLEELSKHLGNKRIENFYNHDTCLHPEQLEDVNYKIIHRKDGKYATRQLQLIHPVFYVELVCLITNESNWYKITKRLSELIDHNKNKNIYCAGLPQVAINYKKEKAEQIDHWLTEVEKKSVNYSLDYDYLLRTDITNCYGSINTSSIVSALHGKKTAKEVG